MYLQAQTAKARHGFARDDIDTETIARRLENSPNYANQELQKSDFQGDSCEFGSRSESEMQQLCAIQERIVEISRTTKSSLARREGESEGPGIPW
jgi:hypothetical protein